ncbi:MAG: hypothetical protein MJ231_06040 [bacterium]|nr:hypothetical protein [bacterium]
MVVLCKDGKRKMFTVHRLVASAFLEKPFDPNATEVNHKDENKTNNIVALNIDGSVNVEESNLEWCSREYNINYGTRNVRVGKAMINGKLSKPVLQFTKDGEFVREWLSLHDVERSLGIYQASVNRCCLEKQKYAGGFIWKYKTA